MSNRLFQSIVYQMHDAIDRTIGVIDETGIVIACSDLVHIGEIHNSMAMNFSNTGDIITKGAYTYKPFGSNSSNEYVLFVEGIDPQAEKYAAVLAVSLTNIKQFYDEKYDRSNFIKNLILDNILQGDVYLKARELHFNNDINRAVLLVCAEPPTLIPFILIIAYAWSAAPGVVTSAPLVRACPNSS